MLPKHKLYHFTISRWGHSHPTAYAAVEPPRKAVTKVSRSSTSCDEQYESNNSKNDENCPEHSSIVLVHAKGIEPFILTDHFVRVAGTPVPRRAWYR